MIKPELGEFIVVNMTTVKWDSEIDSLMYRVGLEVGSLLTTDGIDWVPSVVSLVNPDADPELIRQHVKANHTDERIEFNFVVYGHLRKVYVSIEKDS